jgi:hypothetical protein
VKCKWLKDYWNAVQETANKMLNGHPFKLTTMLFHCIYQNATIYFLSLAYLGIKDNEENFPYSGYSYFNERLAKVVFWCGILYLFLDRAGLILAHLALMSENRSLLNFKGIFLLLTMPFGLH